MNLLHRNKSLHRVLVIEDDGAAECVSAALAQDPVLQCKRVTWDALHGDGLQRCTADLIVAVIGSAEARASVLSELLARHAITIPVVAVVPDVDDVHVRPLLPLVDDFIFMPVRPLEVRHRIARLLGGVRHDLVSVQEQLLQEIGMARLVGRNPAFVDAVRQVPRFARVNATVLITGETGTGKEVCARAIHHLGARRHAPFVPVDCGATPDQLFENELFGHARGAFTDAHRDQKGLVALADGGTLFIDEIDSLSLAAQAKLLRFLQDQTYRPLGSERSERANVRIIAASNQDLDARIQASEFRADLFFRLNILRVHLPPLRERRDDIPLLAQSMVDEFSAGENVRPPALSSGALRVLTGYDWPGNIRELANVVHRGVVECDGDEILPVHVHLPSRLASAALHFRAARAAVVATFERNYIQDLLRKHNGNVTHAAREAQQDRRAFGRFIKKYKIDRRAV